MKQLNLFAASLILLATLASTAPAAELGFDINGRARAMCPAPSVVCQTNAPVTTVITIDDNLNKNLVDGMRDRFGNSFYAGYRWRAGALFDRQGERVNIRGGISVSDKSKLGMFSAYRGGFPGPIKQCLVKDVDR